MHSLLFPRIVRAYSRNQKSSRLSVQVLTCQTYSGVDILRGVPLQHGGPSSGRMDWFPKERAWRLRLAMTFHHKLYSKCRF